MIAIVFREVIDPGGVQSFIPCAAPGLWFLLAGASCRNGTSEYPGPMYKSVGGAKAT